MTETVPLVKMEMKYGKCHVNALCQTYGIGNKLINGSEDNYIVAFLFQIDIRDTSKGVRPTSDQPAGAVEELE